MAVVVLFAITIALLAIGVPIAMALGLSSIAVLYMYSDGSLVSIAQTLFDAFAGHYTLLAIPFFILASTFMATGGVAQRIIRFAIASVAHYPGGLAIAGVFACILFAALSGSSPATVVAIGSIVIAGMRQVGYSKDFAAGLICNAGTLGILIPPSIVMVVYAAAVDVSVGRMFLAGAVPGMVAGLLLIAGILVAAKIYDLPANPRASWSEWFAAASDAAWGLLLIVIVLGGMYGSVFTPTEAAAVAAVYAFFIANFVYRDIGPLKAADEGAPPLSLRQKPQALLTAWIHPDTKTALLEAGRLAVILLFIIANALILKHVLTEQRIPQEITAAMLAAGFDAITFLLFLNIVLLVGGQFMEPSGLIVIVAPLVFPIAMELGIDPIHLGIIMVVNMEIGMITPPVGLNLFVTAGVARMSVADVVKAALPWCGILVLFLILITYVPIISTWLPTQLMGPELVTR